jgi:hypothetical protein
MVKYWHPDTVPVNCECKLCKHYETSPDFRELADGIVLVAGKPKIDASKSLRPLPGLRCRFKGEPTGRYGDCLKCGNGAKVPLLICTKFGTCTNDRIVEDTACCRTCRHRQRDNPFQWISTRKLAADAVKLAAMLPPDVSGIVGIPRSGLIPAAIVATIRHLPLLEINGNSIYQARTYSHRGNMPLGNGPLALVDDTVYQGLSIERVKKSFGGRISLYSAVYVREGMESAVDFHVETVPPLHVLEWNWANNGPMRGMWEASAFGYRGGIAADLDGIICHDDESGGKPGQPYMLPRMHEIPLIITGRQERSRAVTENWLRHWGCKWKRLEMMPNEHEFTAENAAAHKAKHFGESQCGVFIESEPFQAEQIFKLSGKPVICPRIERVFQ